MIILVIALYRELFRDDLRTIEMQNKLGQEIWQAYAVEVGRSLPAGVADKIAAHVLRRFQVIDIDEKPGRGWHGAR